MTNLVEKQKCPPIFIKYGESNILILNRVFGIDDLDPKLQTRANLVSKLKYALLLLFIKLEIEVAVKSQKAI